MTELKTGFEYVCCNICGTDDTVTLFVYGVSKVVKCRKCGLIYKNPRISADEYKKYLETSVDQIDEKVYLAKEKIYLIILNEIERIKNKGKILDIGCGSGYFLKLARDKGWNVYGTEVNPYYIKFAKEKFGIEIQQSNLKEFKDEEFDVVSLLEVIDQFRFPKEELVEVKRILRKGGLLVIRIVNGLWHCTLEKFRKFFSFFGLYPTIIHLYSFTPKTIKHLLNSVGFIEIKILNSHFTKGDPYKTGSNFGKIIVPLCKFVVWVISQILYFLSLKKIYIAPSIIVYARKN